MVTKKNSDNWKTFRSTRFLKKTCARNRGYGFIDRYNYITFFAISECKAKFRTSRFLIGFVFVKHLVRIEIFSLGVCYWSDNPQWWNFAQGCLYRLSNFQGHGHVRTDCPWVTFKIATVWSWLFSLFFFFLCF